MTAASVTAASVATILPGSAVAAVAPTPVTAVVGVWEGIAMTLWVEGANAMGLPVQSITLSDTGALEQYVQGYTDFAVADLPFTAAQEQALAASRRGASYVRVPLLAGATGVSFNIHQTNGVPLSSLNLPADAVCGMATGEATSWNSPLISAANPGVTLPNQRVLPVFLSGPAADSEILSAYCDVLDQPAWAAFTKAQGLPDAPTTQWPDTAPGLHLSGPDLLSNFVKQTVGTIGFDESSFAHDYGVPIASVGNASGAFVLPTTPTIDDALAQLSEPGDYWTKVVAASGAGAYPLDYMAFATAQTRGFERSKGKTLRAFLSYAIGPGQVHLSIDGYSPLPANLLETAAERIVRISDG